MEVHALFARADQLRQELLSHTRKMVARGRAIEIPDPANGLLEALHKLEKNMYQVLVIGEAKRGKSTFVNALIGRSLLPTDVDIATSQVFRVSPSDTESYCLRFEDDSTQEITANDLARYGSQVIADAAETPRLDQIIRWIEVNVPSRFIPPNVTILDTPGLGGLYIAHSQITRRFVPYADAVIFVLESQAPISQPELEILAEVLNCTPHVFFVQTKIDLFRRDDWQKILRRNEQIISERFGDRLKHIRVWPVSSLNLQEAARTGDPDLEIVSRGRELVYGLQEFLFRVAGCSRLAETATLATKYYEEGHKLLTYRLKNLEEGDRQLVQARDSLAARRSRLDKDWSRGGRKRKELGRKLKEAAKGAEAEIANALTISGNIYNGLKKRIVEASSISQIRDIGKALPELLVEEANNVCSTVFKNYQRFCVNTVEPFIEDLNELTVVPSKLADLPSKQQLSIAARREEQVLDALRAGFTPGALGAGALWLSSYGLLNFLTGGLLLPAGIALVAYSLVKAGLQYRQAEKERVAKAQKELLEELDGIFRDVRHRLLGGRLNGGLHSPVRQALEEARRRLLQQIDDHTKRRRDEMDREIQRLEEQLQLAAQEREEKCAGLKQQLVLWDHEGAQLVTIRSRIMELKSGICT